MSIELVVLGQFEASETRLGSVLPLLFGVVELAMIFSPKECIVGGKSYCLSRWSCECGPFLLGFGLVSP